MNDALISDGSTTPDGGVTCRNGERDLDETDVDCGGGCPPCLACRTCVVDADCVSGACADGQCRAVLTTVPTRDGSVPAYVRDDGAILLAHYSPGTFLAGFDTSTALRADSSGGGIAPEGWAPDPCIESGHLAYQDFGAEGARLTLECGLGAVEISVSGTLFSSFEDGIHGEYGARGEPGWGAIASVGGTAGRGRLGMCGINVGYPQNGGIAYCDGPWTGTGYDYSNHLVSYNVAGSLVIVGCGRVGCDDREPCQYSVWVWLRP